MEGNCTEHKSEVHGLMATMHSHCQAVIQSNGFIRYNVLCFFFVVAIVFRTDVIKRNAGNLIAIDYEFIAKTMLSSDTLSIFATFRNEGCCVQMPETLYKKGLLA